MAIPDYESIMLPFLKICEDQKEHSKREVVEKLAEIFQLSQADLQILLPSGKQRTFENRIGWARTYLLKAGLLVATKRSCFQITARGLKLLQQNPAQIDNKLLKQFPEFKAFQSASRGAKDQGTEDSPLPVSPDEILEEAYQNIRQNLAQELLQQVKNCSPAFFERLEVTP